MDLRRIVRGTIPWSDLERVGREIQSRYDRSAVRIEFLKADNWLSTPCVVDDEWFVKIISPQNALVHAVFTGARNLGAMTSGAEGFFERYDSPHEMARHELEATRKLRAIGLNAPKPVEAFECGEFGVLVLEYLPAFETLEEANPDEARQLSPRLFDALSSMHEHHLAHGDLRGENVLLYAEEIYFIDATNVSDEGIDRAAAYDLASALATLSPRIGARDAVRDALAAYSAEELLAAQDFLDIVGLRPDHEFNAGRVKGEIEKQVSRAAR